ncbi:MAG: hypothetical protein V4598_16515 [Bdellovibrionota bacterium]
MARRPMSQYEKDAQKKLMQEIKQQEKEQRKNEKETAKYNFNNLTEDSIRSFQMGRFSYEKSAYEMKPDLRSIFEILKGDGFEPELENKRIKLSDVDHFLYSGKFNSVLGLNGFKTFKEQIKAILDDINRGTSRDNLVNLDALFDLLLHSGIYFETKHLPEYMADVEGEEGWLTAYRFVAKNFPDLTYKEFRTIVKDISKSKGDAIEFEEEEKETNLYKKIASSKLFVADSSPISILQTLVMSDIRAICTELEVQGARSKEQTIEKLLTAPGIEEHLLKKYSHKQNGLVFMIKDKDLVTGADIVSLDKYLRHLAKAVREELFSFVESKMNFKLVG